MNYQDSQLTFIKQGIQSVPFFSNLSEEELYHIIFSLKTKAYLKHTVFQQPGDAANVLYFLQKGCIEVFTFSEGREFVLERLYRGSVINYHTFFQEDYAGEVFLRFSTSSVLKELSLTSMNELCGMFPKLKKAFESFKLSTFKAGKQLPLDYIMVLPQLVMANLYNKTTQQLCEERKSEIDKKIKDEEHRSGWRMNEQERRKYMLEVCITKEEKKDKFLSYIRLENIFKNLALKRFIKIKQEKSEMTIGQMVELMIKKNQEKEAKRRRKIKKKIERCFQVPQGLIKLDEKEKEDPLFNRVLFQFKRIQKILTSHTQAIDSLEKNMELLTSKAQAHADRLGG